MNKLLKNILGGLVLVIISMGFYFFTFQIPKERLVVKDTLLYMTVKNKEIKGEFYEYIENLMIEAVGEERVRKQVKQEKMIKGIDFIVLGEVIKENIEEELLEDYKMILAVDIGWRYPFAPLKQKDYFDDLGGNYFRLKEEFLEEIKEEVPLWSDLEVYMLRYKGYYFLSTDINNLASYLNSLKTKDVNKNITKKLDNNSYFQAVLDTGRIKLFEEKFLLYGVKLSGDYNGKEFIFGYTFYIEPKLLENFQGLPPKDRKFDKYMGKGRFYLNNKDFSSLLPFVREGLSMIVGEYLDLLGVSMEEYLQEIDGEIVFDYVDDIRLILPLKETKKYEEMLGILPKDEKGNYVITPEFKLTLEDKVFYINKGMEKGDIKVGKKEVVSLNLPLKIALKDVLDELSVELDLTGIEIDFGIEVDKDNIKFKGKIKEKDLVKFYKTIMEEYMRVYGVENIYEIYELQGLEGFLDFIYQD